MTTSTANTTARPVLAAGDGLHLGSGPGRDLIFKVTGDDTGGAFDYFTVAVAPKDGPPLHMHHSQAETIHVLKGRFTVRLGDELFQLDEGGFAFLPAGVPHAFVNLTDEPGELVIVFAPGGGHRFFEELGPHVRGGERDMAAITATFETHDMQLLGPPLSAD